MRSFLTPKQALSELIEERCAELDHGRRRKRFEKEWASKARLKPGTWSSYKNGKSLPDDPFFGRLAMRFFALTPDALELTIYERTVKLLRRRVLGDELADEDCLEARWQRSLDLEGTGKPTTRSAVWAPSSPARRCG